MGTPLLKYVNLNDMATKQWLDNTVSCFETVRSNDPYQISLRQWLNSTSNPESNAELLRRDTVVQYRKCGEKSIKLSLPAFCPSAKLNSRSAKLSQAEKIESLTGLMQFDIDGQDNSRVNDFPGLRDRIFKNKHVAFCSLSTSGKGIWGIIRISDVNDFRGHFEQLKKDFLWNYNIVLDPSKGGNPTDLRLYTYDPDAKIRAMPDIYTRKSLWERAKPKRPIKKSKDSGDQLFEKIRTINSKGIDIAPDYDTFVKVGFALAGEYGEAGRQWFHMICQPHPEYDSKSVDLQYNRCIQSKGSGITIRTLYHLINQHLK